MIRWNTWKNGVRNWKEIYFLLVSLHWMILKQNMPVLCLGFSGHLFSRFITVLIYWFIFQIGFKSGDVDGYPFILWLVSGLLPWFFVSDSITNATSSLVEYSYLVKKVLFNINILPVARVVSVFLYNYF